MAQFGAQYPCFKPNGTNTGVVLGRLVSANLSVTLATGELYADDALAEQVSEFASGSIAMETDDITDDNAGVVYGATVSDGIVTYNKNDAAPEGTLGYFKVLIRNGVKSFKGYVYPRAKAALGSDNAQTRGNSVTFNTVQTTFTVLADDNGDWRKTQEFETETEVKSWIRTECGISAV